MDAILQTAKVDLLSLAGVGAFIAAREMPAKAKGQAGTALLAAVVAAAAMLVVGQVYAQVTGDALWGRYSKDPLTTMNNGAAILAVMAWPAVAWMVAATACMLGRMETT